jgi:hypothetical protein
MSQETLVGGAFTWNHIQRLYDADPAVLGSAANPKASKSRMRRFCSSFIYLDFPVNYFLGKVNSFSPNSCDVEQVASNAALPSRNVVGLTRYGERVLAGRGTMSRSAKEQGRA